MYKPDNDSHVCVCVKMYVCTFTGSMFLQKEQMSTRPRRGVRKQNIDCSIVFALII